MGARRRRSGRDKTGFTAFLCTRFGPFGTPVARDLSKLINNQQMVLPDAVVEAARAGEVAKVAQWLKAGGDANERETTGKTLLHCIASDSLLSDEVERGRCDIARLLLARGAEADAKRIHPVFLGNPPRRANRAAARASE